MAELKRKVFFLCGHAHSGKTSLAEAILFKSGAINRLGKIEEGNTISDYQEDERERKSSINFSLLHTQYKNSFLHFIDAPGYLDFVGELIAAARAADFGVIVIDASAGVEVGTEKAWEIIKNENLPCIFFINKLDKENVNIDKIVEELKNSLDKRIVLTSFPKDNKIVNILEEATSSYYTKLSEIVAESNDALLEKYLDQGSLSREEVVANFAPAIGARNIFPVLVGEAINLKGVDIFLDFIDKIMPSSEDIDYKSKTKEAPAQPKGGGSHFSAQVFKTIIDPYVGQLNIFRVFSGKLLSNSEFYNLTKKTKEKIGQIYFLQGKDQLPQEQAVAGDIAAVAKLKHTLTSDTLLERPGEDSSEFKILEFPEPPYSASIKPKTRADEDKISSALSRLSIEDPTLKVSRDPQTKELVISGMGELHLNIIVERMKRKYKVEVELGKPKVPYKETITKRVKVQGKYKKQTGGHGQYGDVWIEVDPLPRGANFEFINKIVGGAIPRNFIPSVEKGIKKAMEEGIYAGYPVVDVRVTLFDGSYHPVDSSDIAFQIAASLAFKKALKEAGSCLLEPIMEVEVAAPSEFMGQITGDINSRRGKVLGIEARGKKEVIKAEVPLAEMFKYASDLRSFTGGRGSYTMHFSHYNIVPERIAKNLAAQKENKEEH